MINWCNRRSYICDDFMDIHFFCLICIIIMQLSDFLFFNVLILFLLIKFCILKLWSPGR
ncbi:hypothetical protein LDENG_00225780, partial [Lucifuga dentata]